MRVNTNPIDILFGAIAGAVDTAIPAAGRAREARGGACDHQGGGPEG